jgi:hypothetical protein
MEKSDVAVTEMYEEPPKRLRLSEEHFNLVPNALLNDVIDGKLHPRDVLVYIVYLDHQRDKRLCWPSNQTIARLTKQSVKNVGKCIGRLVAAGHLARYGKTKYGTKFTIARTRVNGKSILKGQPIPIQNDEAVACLITAGRENLEIEPVQKRRTPIPEDEHGDFWNVPHDRPSYPAIESQDKSPTDNEIPF